MTVIRLDDHPRCRDFLWEKYADLGFGPGTRLTGFRYFVQREIPEVVDVVVRSNQDLVLVFEDAVDAVAFCLKWS